MNRPSKICGTITSTIRVPEKEKEDMAGKVFNEMIGGWQKIPTYRFKKPSKFQTG